MKIIFMLLMIVSVVGLVSAIGIDVPNDVESSLSKSGFDNAIIKEVDCNTGLFSTKCFILTNGIINYNLINLNVMTCSRPEMIKEITSQNKIINGKSKLIVSYRYRKTGKCIQYGELSQSTVTNVLTSVAEKKLVDISGIKPVITNPPKTYGDIQLTTTSSGGDLM